MGKEEPAASAAAIDAMDDAKRGPCQIVQTQAERARSHERGRLHFKHTEYQIIQIQVKRSCCANAGNMSEGLDQPSVPPRHLPCVADPVSRKLIESRLSEGFEAAVNTVCPKWLHLMKERS